MNNEQSKDNVTPRIWGDTKDKLIDLEKLNDAAVNVVLKRFNHHYKSMLHASKVDSAFKYHRTSVATLTETIRALWREFFGNSINRESTDEPN